MWPVGHFEGGTAMKTKQLVAFILGVVLTMPVFGGKLPPPFKYGTWELIPELTDEFNGNELDSGKWRVIHDTTIGYRSNNVSVSNGQLHIVLESVGTNLYTSGMIQSLAKARYGYFEAKCRLTKATADNAFWLTATYYWLPATDPSSSSAGYSEIDVFESSASGNLANEILTTLHRESPAARTLWSEWIPAWQAPVNLNKDFHRYGLEWDEDRIVVYFDGKPVNETENKDHYVSMTVAFNLFPHEVWGWPLDTDLPSTFDIQYIRAWKRTDVVDNRIWDFQFPLPDNEMEYRIPTEDQATLLIYRKKNGAGRYVKVDYLNPAYFASQTDSMISRTVETKDKYGKIVRFFFDWRASTVDPGPGRYEGYRLYIEPANKGPKGTTEDFVFIADNGLDVTLTITY